MGEAEWEVWAAAGSHLTLHLQGDECCSLSREQRQKVL